MKEGLLPYVDEDYNLKAIFLFDSLEVAQSCCDPESVVLEITVLVETVRKWIWNEANSAQEYLRFAKVSPKNIKVVHEGY